MSKAKSITIKLTTRQREQLRGLTGETHDEVKFEAVPSTRAEMAPKAALVNKAVGRKAMARIAAPRAVRRLVARAVARKTLGRNVL